MKKIIFLFLGILYYLVIQIDIVDMRTQSRKTSFTIDTFIPQYVKLHIQANRNHLQVMRCTTKEFIFPIRDRLWFERKTQEVYVYLKRGKNYCEIVPQKNVKFYSGKIKRKYTFINYIILFILVGLPLFSWIFSFFIVILDKLRLKYIKKNKEKETVFFVKDISLSPLIWTILLLGMTIRILYFQKFGISHFQHDIAGHIEFIKYMAEYWSLPLGEKGLQFPQQPLYYVISGGIYSVLMKLGMSDRESLYSLGYFSLFCAFIFLYYGYKFFTLITENKWVQIVALLFISLTPSLVYMSARINNDVLVMALSGYALYQIVRSYQTQFQNHFYEALIGVTLLFMTKISSAPMEIFLFLLLASVYIEQEDNKEIKYKLFIFGIVGTFVLGITLLKTYLPIEQTFHMVNSSGRFPGQIIQSLDLSYFATFHLYTLISTGYSYVFGENSIRYSFLTYQYGTMFFGEFEYSSLLRQYIWLKEIMQIVFTFGLIYVVGFLVFVIKLHKVPLLHKFIFLTFVLNFILILKFMLSYPVVCNTDFRYFVVSLGILAFVFAEGLRYLSNYKKWLKYLINILVGVLSIVELLYFTLILL
jgi:hypothetical protein